MPQSPEIGPALFKASQDADNYERQVVGPRPLRGGQRHMDAFLTASAPIRECRAGDALPLALRLGNNRPDWRTPSRPTLPANWKPMKVPGNWETRGLPDFDGAVWFTPHVRRARPAAPTTLASDAPATSGRCG